jgi:hypothetical protein
MARATGRVIVRADAVGVLGRRSLGLAVVSMRVSVVGVCRRFLLERRRRIATRAVGSKLMRLHRRHAARHREHDRGEGCGESEGHGS